MNLFKMCWVHDYGEWGLWTSNEYLAIGDGRFWLIYKRRECKKCGKIDEITQFNNLMG
jgi:hypothetical protein